MKFYRDALLLTRLGIFCHESATFLATIVQFHHSIGHWTATERPRRGHRTAMQWPRSPEQVAIERGPFGGDQSRCACPAREDRGNLTRPATPGSTMRVRTFGPRRLPNESTPKSKKEKPQTLEAATHCRSIGGCPTRQRANVRPPPEVRRMRHRM